MNFIRGVRSSTANAINEHIAAITNNAVKIPRQFLSCGLVLDNSFSENGVLELVNVNCIRGGIFPLFFQSTNNYLLEDLR
jgi:hypothetical protein